MPWRQHLRGAEAAVPPGGWSRWNRWLLAATDRSGHRAFGAIADNGRTAICEALQPIMAPDAVLCTDGHAAFWRIARDLMT
jgi:hypothetical protein